MITDRQCCDLAAATYDTTAKWDYLFQGEAVDDVYVGLKKLPGFDVIAGRGSDCGLDWLRDGDAVPVLYEPFGYVHSGFFRGVLSAYAAIKPFLTQPVVLTGHSLGASHVQYLAGLLTVDGALPAKVCCFGSPKPGYQKFAEVVAPIANYTLYKNGPDYVTDAPLTLPNFPYSHARPLTDILEIPATNELSLFAFHHIFLYQQGMPNG